MGKPNLTTCPKNRQYYKALSEIRSREQETSSHHLPVIALTAYSLSHDRKRFLQEGFDGHVSKPVEVKLLIKEIKRVLAIRDES